MILRKKLLSGTALTLILAAAVFTRFYGLRDRGIFVWDEGFHLNGARTYCAAASYFCNKIIRHPAEFSFGDYMVNYGGGYPYSAKPLFYPMVAMSFLILGIHDYSLLFLSAILGVLSVLLIYYVGNAVYNKAVGITSALLLAISPYHINYSRSGLSISASICFILAAFYFYIKSIKQREGDVLYAKSKIYISLTGIFTASAFGCHYNLIWFIPFLLFTDIFNYFIAKGITLRQQIIRVAIYSASFLLVFISYILPFQIAGYVTKGLVGKRSAVPYHILNYFEQIKWNVTQIGGFNFSTQNSLFYIRLLKIVENPLVLILAITGVFSMCSQLRKKIDLPGLMVLFLCVVPIAFWSFYTYKGGRTIAVIIPFLTLSAAYSINRLGGIMLTKSLRLRRVISLLLFCLVITWGIYKSIPAIGAASNYRKTIDFMRKRGDVKHISNIPPISIFYAGNENTNFLPILSSHEITALYKNKNYTFFLNVGGISGDKSRLQLLYERIKEKDIKPVFKVGSSPYLVLFESAIIEDEKTRRKNATIEVYYLKDILG